jgi:hypothetical protein
MKKLMMILMGAVLASNVVTAAAKTRSQVVDNGDRFGSDDRHTSVGSGTSRRGSGLRYRSTFYFGTSQAGYSAYNRHNARCRFPAEWPKLPPWPPFCN